MTAGVQPPWIVNSGCRFKRRSADAFVIEAPIKGQSLRRTCIHRREDEALYDVLERILSGQLAASTIDPPIVAKLLALGLLVEPQNAPDRVYFFGSAAEQAFAPTHPDETESMACSFERGSPERDSRERVSAGWLPSQSDYLFWVTDSATNLSWPSVLDGPDAALANALADGHLDPAGLDPAVRRRFHAGGLLSSTEAVRLRRTAFEERCTKAREYFASLDYAPVLDMLPPPLTDAVRRYYRALTANGYLHFDVACARYTGYDEPVCRWLHLQFGEIVRRLCPRPVKPSYSYVSVYTAQGVLAPHLDRPQCEITLAVTIDLAPESPRDTAWPLLFELSSEEKRVPLHLGVGDAVIFRGRRLKHWREPSATCQALTTLLFHFVDAEFSESLH